MAGTLEKCCRDGQKPCNPTEAKLAPRARQSRFEMDTFSPINNYYISLKSSLRSSEGVAVQVEGTLKMWIYQGVVCLLVLGLLTEPATVADGGDDMMLRYLDILTQ